MHKFVYHNDRLIAMGEVRLSPGQAGLLNGWGVFTTIHVAEGQPFAFERHWARLTGDAKRIEMAVPYSAENVRQKIGELLRANRVTTAALRIYFVLNRAGIWSSDEPLPLVDMIMYTIDLPQRVGPTRLSVMAHGRQAAHPLAGTKVTSWLYNAWALEQAHHQGCDDMLLLNERGEVSECTAANIFAVHAGAVVTPPLDSGCLNGVTRQILFEEAPRISLPVREQAFSLEGLYGADEVCISSTTRHVQPVGQIGDHKYAQAPGPVTQRLERLFADYFERYLESAKSKVGV
ncbi:MAG TPA: aminotransferase class IV [Terriglobales bacterium]|nr:aminotransferase class IV [Terriglobales bacterium]